MDDRTKYTSFAIPQREARPPNEVIPSTGTIAANAVLLTDIKFAEIEFETTPNHASAGETALRFYSSVTSPQPIEQKAIDPIRQKFYDMRSLATDRPFARDDAELFYRQAKFMEDFSDDYKNETRFFMYFPYYQHMGYEQLRTYFTWRAKARAGEIQPTSASYVFLYIYELLSGIGVNDTSEGLNKLVSLWNASQKTCPELENYIPQWIKDYHVYYDLQQSFTDFVKEHNLQKYYSLSLIFETESNNSLELWNSISSYDVTQSKFYKEGNEQLFRDYFNAALNTIRRFCADHNSKIEDLLIYSISKRTPWHPFKHALFHNWLQQPDRQVKLPGQERYYCKNNQWSANLPIYYSSQKDFVGYIIKKMESCLRQEMKYKYKLSADIKVAGYSFRELRGMSAKIAELDNLIEKSVTDFRKDLTRTVVTVDHANLARIREEALGTQEKLFVPENESVNAEFGIRNPELWSEPVKPTKSGTQAEQIEQTESEEKPEQIEQPKPEEENERIEQPEQIEQDEPGEETARIEQPEQIEQDEPGYMDYDGWASFQAALSKLEREALGIALIGGVGIKAFADKNGIMLEVLADGINEKAADYIGDNILEVDDGMTIYDEYKAQVAEISAPLSPA